MARRLKNGSIILDNGEPFFGDDPISAQALIEVLNLLTPPPAWPFVGGGGGISGRAGELGMQGNQGVLGVPGPQGNQGFQGSQGIQGNQGLRGIQGNQGNIGDTQSSIFEFSHNSGSASTGALGFTPRFALYSGIVRSFDSPNTSHVLGFAIATDGQMGAGWGIGVNVLQVAAGGVAGGINIFGEVTPDRDPPLNVQYFNNLVVEAFSSAGISLHWDMDVAGHSGKMLVMGS